MRKVQRPVRTLSGLVLIAAGAIVFGLVGAFLLVVPAILVWTRPRRTVWLSVLGGYMATIAIVAVAGFVLFPPKPFEPRAAAALDRIANGETLPAPELSDTAWDLICVRPTYADGPQVVAATGRDIDPPGREWLGRTTVWTPPASALVFVAGNSIVDMIIFERPAATIAFDERGTACMDRNAKPNLSLDTEDGESIEGLHRVRLAASPPTG